MPFSEHYINKMQELYIVFIREQCKKVKPKKIKARSRKNA